MILPKLYGLLRLHHVVSYIYMLCCCCGSIYVSKCCYWHISHIYVCESSVLPLFHTHTHTNTHIYVSLSLCVCMCACVCISLMFCHYFTYINLYICSTAVLVWYCPVLIHNINIYIYTHTHIQWAAMMRYIHAHVHRRVAMILNTSMYLLSS